MLEERVSIGNLKARLSEYLRRAKAGRGIIVTDRGRPVAKLVALDGEPALESRIAELVRSGRIQPPEQSLDLAFLAEPRPEDPDGRSLDALLEERAEGW